MGAYGLPPMGGCCARFVRTGDGAGGGKRLWWWGLGWCKCWDAGGDEGVTVRMVNGKWIGWFE